MEKHMASVDLKVPEYYFENSYLDGKIKAIRGYMDECQGEGEAFFFITDMHWDYNARRSPALIRYISERLPIERLFNGGDNYHTGLRSYAPDALRACFSGEIYNACGNHEYMFGVTGETVRDIFDVKGENVVFGDRLRNYYYVENHAQKTRYVVINGWQPQNGDEAWRSVAGIDERQLTWLAETALQVDEGWTILIFTHNIFSISTITDVPRIMDEFHFDQIAEVIQAYHGKGTIAAIVQGHTHRDRIAALGNIPVLITTSDQRNPYVEPGGVADINVDRSLGTINEQAFDVCILNKRERKLTAVRIGAKAKDNDGCECEERVVFY